MYSLFKKLYNWWKFPYFYRYRRKLRGRRRFFKRKRYYLRFRWRRYTFYRRPRYVFSMEDNTEVNTLPIFHRKNLFVNVYFSKLWIMHVFGWLVLKFNILIPRKKSRRKRWLSRIRRIKRVRSGRVKKKTNFFNFEVRSRSVLKNRLSLIKNMFLYNLYVKSKNTDLNNFLWF